MKYNQHRNRHSFKYKLVEDDDKDEDIIVIDRDGNRIKTIIVPDDIKKSNLLKQVWDDGCEDGFQEGCYYD